MLRKIDDFIFDMPIGMQVIANVIDRSTGIQHHNQARIVVILATAWTINILWSEFMRLIGSGEIATSIVCAMAWNVMVVLLVFIMTSRAQSSTTKGFRNVLRLPTHEMLFRLMHVFMAVSTTWRYFMVELEDEVFLDHITFTGLAVALYLTACDKPPPVYKTAPQT